MKLLLIFIAFVPFGLAPAQTNPQKTVAKPIVVRSGSTTRGDFWVILGKLSSAADTILGNEKRSNSKPDRLDDPVTRTEIITALKGTFDHFRPKFRVAPRPGFVDMKAIKERNPLTTQSNLEILVKWGMIGPVGPLVVGPGENLSPQQVGDALGYFFSQLTILTHKALPKWTPKIEPQDGG